MSTSTTNYTCWGDANYMNDLDHTVQGVASNKANWIVIGISVSLCACYVYGFIQAILRAWDAYGKEELEDDGMSLPPKNPIAATCS